jgi:hypothetical protein
MARRGVFVVRCREDGSAWFAALAGTVVVRALAGGTVVLQAGEALATSPSGALGEVERAGLHRLADDDWIALNLALDVPAVTAAEDEGSQAPEVPVGPGPIDDPVAISSPSPAPVDIPSEGDHPWRVGIAALLAVGLGIFSVVIGRSAATDDPPPDDERSPAVAVPGPPSFAAPAVTTPPTPTTAPPAPRYDVDGRTCSRRAGRVHYTGTIRNDDAVARAYTVEVRFLDRSGNAVATASTAVAAVPAGATRSFHLTGTGAGLRTATDCEVGTVVVRS